jgi:RNA polymerase sigma factor (sigma-70 family)
LDTETELFEQLKGKARAIAMSKYYAIGAHLSGIDFDDLIQEANIALWKAIRNYNDNKECSIKTWSMNLVHYRLLDFCRSQDYVTRGHRRELGVERLNVQFFPEHEKGEGLRESMIESPDTNPEDHTIHQEVREVIYLYETKEDYRLILIEYYFIDMTQKEIANKWRISEGRISQILTAELRKLRNYYQGKRNGSRRNRQKGPTLPRNQKSENRLHLVQDTRRSTPSTSVQRPELSSHFGC